ncbi:MAG: 3'-5' exonuclease [Candidatus Subteraquimicrobiales bacterium]|nr:3'-5' exonuclease [Candidatus Subteraquimicrobiales bacterium]
MIVILDTETTSLKDPRVVEAAIAIIPKHGDLNAVSMMSERYKPPVPIEIGAMATHGITEDDVENSPKFEEGEIIKWLNENNTEDNIMVIHNASFDLGVLKNEGVEIKMKIIDTLRCCKKIFMNMPNVEVNLQYLKYYLFLYREEKPPAIQEASADAHSAGGDVATLYLMFRRMVNRYGLDELVEMSSKPVFYEIMPFGKHKGKRISDMVQKEKGYVTWALKEMDDQDVLYTIKYHMKVNASNK